MEIVDVAEEINRELMNDMKGMTDGFVQVGDRKWFFPSKYREVADELRNFEVRSDDIWIMGYPRSGTTLTQELVWQLIHNLDSSKGNEGNERAVFFENIILLNENRAKEITEKFPNEAAHFQNIRDNLKKAKSYKSRRIIKTHLPFELLPPDLPTKGCKIIYLCRYPKDVCVSFYHLQVNNRMSGSSIDFKKFWSNFRNGYDIFGPYFEHIQQAFERIGSENYMFELYEDFVKDNKAYIQKLCDFLEIELTDNDRKKIEEFVDIDNFRKTNRVAVKNDKNEDVSLVRKGKVGGWTEYFTQEMSDEADAWIEMNTKRIGIRFPKQNE